MKLCVLPDNAAALAGTPCQAGTPRPAVARAVSRCRPRSSEPGTPSAAPRRAKKGCGEGVPFSGASHGLGQPERLCQGGCAMCAVTPITATTSVPVPKPPAVAGPRGPARPGIVGGAAGGGGGRPAALKDIPVHNVPGLPPRPGHCRQMGAN